MTKILSEELGTKAFFEPVEDNPVLPLFYRGNKMVEAGEADSNPYTFLLQVFFLNRRFAMIKQAMQEDNNVLDRSIYEDSIYKSLLNNMLEELPYAAKKKSPDLMIMIDVNLETMLHRIKKRGRDYEQIDTDPSLVKYYDSLIRYYDEWKATYDKSPLLIIDGNKLDFVEDPDDRNTVLNMIEEKMVDVGTLEQARYDDLRARREG